MIIEFNITQDRGARPSHTSQRKLYTEKESGRHLFSEFSSCRNMAAIAKDNSSGGSNAKTNFETPVVKSESTFLKNELKSCS